MENYKENPEQKDLEKLTKDMKIHGLKKLFKKSKTFK